MNKKMDLHTRNTGITIGPKKDSDFVFGDGNISHVNNEADWSKYLSEPEPQSILRLDTMGCASFSAINSIETQINWMHLNEHINVFNNNLRVWLDRQNYTLHNPHALIQLQMQLSSQANMIAFIDAYRLICILLICFIPLVLLLKNVKLTENKSTGH